MAVGRPASGLALDPNGQTATVTITDPTGTAISLFAEQTMQTPVANPFTLTGVTQVWSNTAAQCTISALVGGLEAATATGPAQYRFGDGDISGIQLIKPVLTPALANSTYQVKETAFQVTAEAYGAVGDGVTDDTAAIQAAIDAIAAKGGGTLLLGVGSAYGKGYLVNAAPRTDRRGYSILALPATGQGTIIIKGLGGQQGSYLKTTRTTDTYSGTYGPPSVLGGPTPENAGGSGLAAFSNWNITLDSLDISLPANPKIAGYDFGEMIYARVLGHPSVYTASSAGVFTQPTANYAFGLRLPRSLNSGSTEVEVFSAFGMYVGVVFSSPHADIRSLTTQHCLLGVGMSDDVNATTGDAHASRIAYWQSESCKYHLGGWSVTGGAQENAAGTTTRLVIDLWDIENKPSGWDATSFHILDQNNTLIGSATYNHVNGGAGPTTAQLTIFGAGNFALNAITDPVLTGPWTAYTPTVGGTGWALGNGTATGRYSRVGKTIHFVANVTFGTTSTFGAGGLTVGMPLARVFTSNVDHGALTRSVHGGVLYYGTADLGNNTSAAACQALTATTGAHAAVTATVPYTWVSGDQITVSGTYETV